MTAPPPPRPFIELPRYTKDSLPLGDWQYFRKTATTQMARVNGPFVVETLHGSVICQDGWLAVDTAGYPYPIAADEHTNSYEPSEGQG